MRRSRVFVALLLLAATLALFWAQNLLLWRAVTLLLAVVAAGEWAKLAGLRTAESYVFMALFGVFAAAAAAVLDFHASAQNAFFAVVCGFWVLAAPWWLLGKWRLGGVIFGFLGMVLLFAAWHAAAVLFVADANFLLAVLAAVWIADSFAFVVGKLLGRSPMAPDISGGKTWEGFLGAMTAVLAAAWYWNTRNGNEVSLPWLLTAAFVLVALSALGDLFESGFKRQAGVKDSGTILGAHGGVLDRIDAALPVLPFAVLWAPWLT